MAASRSCRIARDVRIVAVAGLAVAAVLVPATRAQAQQEKELKLSVAVGPAYALGKAGDRWAKRIAEKSDGRLAVKLFPGASLAQRDPVREFAALKDGTADLAVGSTLFWSAQVKQLAVVGLPWLAAGPQRLDALLSGPVADMLRAAVTRADVVPLALAPLGHRALATREHAVETPGDLAGIRVRILGPPAIAEFFAALGAKPQVLSFAAAEAAFAAGALDAEEGTPAMFAATHLDAVGLKQVLLWDAIAEAAVFAVNRTRWESWSEADRALVRDSALEVAADLAGLVQQENDAALRALRKGGMTIARLTPSGRAAFAGATPELYAQWAAAAGTELVKSAEAAVAPMPP